MKTHQTHAQLSIVTFEGGSEMFEYMSANPHVQVIRLPGFKHRPGAQAALLLPHSDKWVASRAVDDLILAEGRCRHVYQQTSNSVSNRRREQRWKEAYDAETRRRFPKKDIDVT